MVTVETTKDVLFALEDCVLCKFIELVSKLLPLPPKIIKLKKPNKEILNYSPTKTYPILKAGDDFITGALPIVKYLIKSSKDDSDGVILDNRKILLGKGGFAKCYELICQDNNKTFAAKMLPLSDIKTERQKHKLLTEIKIHKSLHHQQIVAFEHHFKDKTNVYILLELCQNQTLNELFERRKKLTEIEVQCYMIQLIKALQYLHSHRVIHRDLKLGNLFLNDKMELKVGDFGLATKSNIK